jgi:hypothetical protein
MSEWKTVPGEPVATVTLNESMGAEFKFNRPHTLLPGEVLYVYTAPQPKQDPDRAFLERTLAAMEGVIDVADRKTDEFDALRSCVIDLTLMLHSDAPQPQRTLTVEALRQDFERQYKGHIGTTRMESGRYLSPSIDDAWKAYAKQFIQPQREWVGLTETDLANCDTDEYETARRWERLLREKNGGEA